MKGYCACPRQELNRVLTGSAVLTLALFARGNFPKCNNADTPLWLVVTVLTLRFQEMVNGEVPDLLTDSPATHTGGTPVDSTQHASFNHAFSDFIKCSKGLYYARRGCAFQFYDDSQACSEQVFQYLFRRSGISCVPCDVVGKWRRGEKWRPTGIRNRLGIAVTVCRAAEHLEAHPS